MGWLGWTWDTIKDQDVNVLQLALDGRSELLTMLFASREKGAASPKGPITKELWATFAANNNRRYVAPQRGRRKK